ncbi:MAG: hypothetical protein ACYC63_00515 [Armatimonadota bacterium]
MKTIVHKIEDLIQTRRTQGVLDEQIADELELAGCTPDCISRWLGPADLHPDSSSLVQLDSVIQRLCELQDREASVTELEPVYLQALGLLAAADSAGLVLPVSLLILAAEYARLVHTDGNHEAAFILQHELVASLAPLAMQEYAPAQYLLSQALYDRGTAAKALGRDEQAAMDYQRAFAAQKRFIMSSGGRTED